MNLRPYQLRAIEAARAAWVDHPGAMLVLATGTGKTRTGLSVAADCVEQGGRVVWLAGRQELLDQPSEACRSLFPAIRTGIVQASRHTPDASIVFASVQTLATSPARTAEILSHGPISLLVVDEAHHSVSPSWVAAMEAIGAPNRLGLTATPHRDDGADLGEHWQIAYSYGIAEAVRDGALVPPLSAVDRVPDLHLEEITGRYDYDDGELGAELLRAGIVDHTVRSMLAEREWRGMLTRAVGRGSLREHRSLVYTATVEQARLTAEALRTAGFTAQYISGETPTAERERFLRAFRVGKIDVLCSAAVLTEGTDLPIAAGIVLARPTRSWSLYVQMVGRGMRLHAGKADCRILDLAGATEWHSLISAPVLIGGSPCPSAPAHEFDGVECRHCGKKVPCPVHLGPHAFAAGVCECGQFMCPDSPEKEHAWIPIESFRRRCLYCAKEIRDPLAGLVGAKQRRPDAVEGDWVRLRQVRPDCAAVDVGEHGILYVTWQGDSYRPAWLPKGGRKARPLSDGPVAKEHVRAYADDIVTRAARIAAAGANWKRAPQPTDAAVAYGMRYGVAWQGETAGEHARRVFSVRARERAVAVGLVEEVR